jgi:hypothetical protein
MDDILPTGPGKAGYRCHRFLLAMACLLPLASGHAEAADLQISGSASGSNQQLVLNAQLEPATADNGKNGNIYVGARYNERWHFMTANGWQPWSSGDLPVFRSTLLIRQTLPILDGRQDVSSLVGSEIYVGYGSDQQDMQSFGKYNRIYTISASNNALLGGWPNTGAPQLSPALSGTTTGATTFSAAINEDGTGYYLVQPADRPAPTASAVVAAGHGFAMRANTLATVTIGGLQAATAYTIYFVAVDQAGNTQSSPTSVALTTLNLPATTAGPLLLAASDNSVNFSVTVDSDGTGYYLVQPSAQPAPTVASLLAANHSFAMRANSPSKVSANGLQAATAYTVYFVAKNIWGDSQAHVSSLPFTTAASGALPSGYVYQGGLVWMPVKSHATWAKAKAYCPTFNGLGLSGWRQPSSGEAVSLLASGAANGQGWAVGYLWTYEQDYLGNPVAVDPNGLVVWIEGGGDDGYINIACVR